MKTLLNSASRNSLPVSLRLVRLLISILLVVAIVTETSLSGAWQAMLSVLSLYTFVTGIYGRDPVFALLRTSGPQIPNQALHVVAQVECLSIGLICVVTGIVYHNVDSVIIKVLPFIGIYPILLCAVKHDVLGYILQSYREGMSPHKPG